MNVDEEIVAFPPLIERYEPAFAVALAMPETFNVPPVTEIPAIDNNMVVDPEVVWIVPPPTDIAAADELPRELVPARLIVPVAPAAVAMQELIRPVVVMDVMFTVPLPVVSCTPAVVNPNALRVVEVRASVPVKVWRSMMLPAAVMAAFEIVAPPEYPVNKIAPVTVPPVKFSVPEPPMLAA